MHRSESSSFYFPSWQSNDTPFIESSLLSSMGNLRIKEKSELEEKIEHQYSKLFDFLEESPPGLYKRAVCQFLDKKALLGCSVLSKSLQKKIDLDFEILTRSIARENNKQDLNRVIHFLSINNYKKLSREPGESLGEFIDRYTNNKKKFQKIVRVFFENATPEFHNFLLKKLSTRNTNIDLFNQIIKNLPESITNLDLSFCSDISDENLAPLVYLINLKDLNLSECNNITDEGVFFLKRLVNLQSLNLWRCEKLTDRSLSYLEQLSNLRDLYLWGCNRITDDALIYLKNLPINKLNLSCCDHITDEGLSFLKEFLSLQDLSLWGCDFITDIGLSYLKDLPLTSLDLGCCLQVTDQGVALLEKVENVIAPGA